MMGDDELTTYVLLFRGRCATLLMGSDQRSATLLKATRSNDNGRTVERLPRAGRVS